MRTSLQDHQHLQFRVHTSCLVFCTTFADCAEQVGYAKFIRPSLPVEGLVPRLRQTGEGEGNEREARGRGCRERKREGEVESRAREKEKERCTYGHGE